MHVYGLFCSLQWHGQEGHDGVSDGEMEHQVVDIGAASGEVYLLDACIVAAFIPVLPHVRLPPRRDEDHGVQNHPH